MALGNSTRADSDAPPSTTRIWLVMDHDYDSNWCIAAYTSRAVAEQHAALDGAYSVADVEVLTELAPERSHTAKTHLNPRRGLDIRS